MTQKLIGYKILINTDLEDIELPMFFDAMPIDERRVTKEIRNEFIAHRITHISADMVNELLLVATDGDELQIYDIDPLTAWPAEFNMANNSEFYKDGGDSK